MKKVLYVFGSLRRDGAQLRTLEVCRVLQRRYPMQFDFCVLGRGPIQLKAEIESIGGTIHSVPIRSPLFAGQFSALLRKEKYDVVESEPGLFSGPIIWLAMLRKVPIRIANLRVTLGGQRGLWANPVFIWLMRRLIKHSATHIVGISQSALDSMFPPKWQASCDCRVIYSGIHPDLYHGAEQRIAVRNEFEWPLDSRIVINVARFYPEKNHEIVLEATSRAHEKYGRIRLLLVGDGELSARISESIEAKGLQDICAMAGVRTDVARLLLASDLFIFPTLVEGLPGALLEALAAGLPAVTSNIHPIREIAQYFPSSIAMAPPRDSEQHAEHMLMALEMKIDRATAQQHFARTPFAFSNTAEEYGSLYALIEG